MKRLFVDTGAWLAVAARADDHHERAAAFYRSRASSTLWLTSDCVLDELATRLRALQSADSAVTFVRTVRASKACRVLSIDDDLVETALGLMLKFSDHRLSFTDCTSFALINELGVREAYAFDADFARCGYSILP